MLGSAQSTRVTSQSSVTGVDGPEEYVKEVPDESKDVARSTLCFLHVQSSHEYELATPLRAACVSAVASVVALAAPVALVALAALVALSLLRGFGRIHGPALDSDTSNASHWVSR